MEFRIWVETRLAGRIIDRQVVAQVERLTIGPEEIGMSLAEGKTLLHQVQARIIQAQADVLGAAHWRCDLCGRRQPIKDRRTRCVRTVFGTPVPLRAIFEAPTVAGLAAVIAQHASQSAEEQDIARILSEVEGMSEEEAQRLLEAEK